MAKAVYKSNGGRIGGRVGTCKITDEGAMSLWIHAPDEPENGHWSEIELKADTPEPPTQPPVPPEPPVEPPEEPEPPTPPEPPVTPPEPPTVPPQPVPGTANVNGRAELMQALDNANPGDVLKLAPGNYGVLDNARAYGGEVIMQSADPANPAVFNEALMRNGRNLTMDGLKFKFNHTGQHQEYPPFGFYDCNNYTLRNSDIEGDIAGSQGAVGVGLRTQGCTGFNIQRNKIHKFLRAIYMFYCTDTLVELNEVFAIRSDGFNPVGADRCDITRNYLHDFGGVAGNQDHRDMIQIVGAGGAASRDVNIDDNLFVQDADPNDNVSGSWTQTIWAGGDGRNGTANHRYIGIRRNIIINSHLWGIGMNEVEELSVVDNLMAEYPRVDPNYPGIETPTILVSCEQPNVSGNKAPRITVNGSNVDGQNGNEAVDLDHAALFAQAKQDSRFAHFFG